MAHPAGGEWAWACLGEDQGDIGGVTGLLHEAMGSRVAEVDRSGLGRVSRRTRHVTLEVGRNALARVVAALVARATEGTIVVSCGPWCRRKAGGASAAHAMMLWRFGTMIGGVGPFALAFALTCVSLEKGVIIEDGLLVDARD